MKEDIINGSICPICGKAAYTSEKRAVTAMHTIVKHSRTCNKTDIPKRAFYSKECGGVWHLTHFLKGEYK